MNLSENVSIEHGDCIELMKDIPDKSIDMILCDLPYGVTACKWDNKLDLNNLWEQYNRVIKKNCPIVLFSSMPFTVELISSNIKNFNYCWYWIKNQGTNFFHAKRMPIRKVEEICVFNSKVYYPQMSEGHIPTNNAKGCSNGIIYFGVNKRDYLGGSTQRYPTNILEYNCVNNYKKLHPNEKPVGLLEYLIKTYTTENKIILDNTAGVFSTGIACINTNRKFIGYELNDDYFEIGKKRIIEALDRKSKNK